MKRLFLTLVPWMALASIGGAQTRFAEVRYTHRDAAPVRAFRLGDECFLPVDTVSTLGWTVTARDDRADIVAEGRSFSVPVRNVGGRNALPLRKALQLMGASSDWVPRSDTLDVFAPISSVSVHNGRLQATSGLAIKPNVYVLSSPSRLIVEFAGARLTKTAATSLESGVRVSQYKDDVVRVVVEAPNLSESPHIDVAESREVDLDLRAVLNASARKTSDTHVAEVAPARNDAHDNEPVKNPVQTTTNVATNDPVDVTFRVDKDSETSTTLSAAIKGLAITEIRYVRPDPTSLEVTIPRFAGQIPIDTSLRTNAVSSVTARREGWNTIIVFQFPRATGAEVVADAVGMQIRLLKPRVGDGRLAGKVVVVDPGHGGRDPGSQAGGVNEKDLTLPVSLYLAEDLAKEGATVIMTRNNDTYPTLTDRTSLANRNNADFFISVHINKTNSSAMSGTITFYHHTIAVSRLLAECIHSELVKVTKLPNIGVWQDTKIYPKDNKGFQVLRETPKMPGVLLELGFIGNPNDRKRMMSDDFRHAVAAAVVKGLKVYLGDVKTKQ